LKTVAWQPFRVKDSSFFLLAFEQILWVGIQFLPLRVNNPPLKHEINPRILHAHPILAPLLV
jgi:hypothetical protein